MPINVTGNSQIDGATAEIAGHIRDGRVGSHARWRDQDHYDEAMRLRDEIRAGQQVIDAEWAREHPAASPEPQQYTIRIVVRGDRAVVEVTGGQPLPPGRYLGAVVKLRDSMGEVA